MEEGASILKKMVLRRNNVQQQIKDMDHFEYRNKIVDAATQVFKDSQGFYLERNFETGKAAAQLGNGLLDFAISFHPIGAAYSWGRDVVEAITKRNLYTGDPLDNLSYNFAMMGAMTFGFGGKIGKILEKYARAGQMERVNKLIAHVRSMQKTLDHPNLKILDVNPGSLRSMSDRLNFRSQPHRIIRGSDAARGEGGKRAFIADGEGKIVLEITPQRTKIRVQNPGKNGEVFETFFKGGDSTPKERAILDLL